MGRTWVDVKHKADLYLRKSTLAAIEKKEEKGPRADKGGPVSNPGQRELVVIMTVRYKKKPMLERLTRLNPQNLMIGSTEEGGRQGSSPTCISALSDQED